MTKPVAELTDPERRAIKAVDNGFGRFARYLVARFGAVRSSMLATVAITVVTILTCLITYEIIGLDYLGNPISVVMPIVMPLVTGFPTTLVIHRLVAATMAREQQGLRQQAALRAAADESALHRARAERTSQATSDFLASMSHELRTPLNAIIGGADMIRNQSLGPVGDERYLQTAEDISLGGMHLLQMINTILDLAKLERGAHIYQMEPIPVGEIIENAVRIVRGQAEQAGIVIRFTPPPEQMQIICDDQAMRQVMLNLLSNAIKFSPAESTVHVDAVAESDGRICIRVADSGFGIPKDQLDDIFQPFVQVDSVRTRSQQGTGLGLALVRTMVEQQGGQVSVESTPGHGSVFSLAFEAAAKV
ncbi:MAG: HAMP domain-containing sensor histidine kinase [Minwuia sp.]|nr:HAMP domain-containing sensor histidine kinase [Minwuia sp.]